MCHWGDIAKWWTWQFWANGWTWWSESSFPTLMNLWFYDFYNYIALTQIQATFHPTCYHKIKKALGMCWLSKLRNKGVTQNLQSVWDLSSGRGKIKEKTIAFHTAFCSWSVGISISFRGHAFICHPLQRQEKWSFAKFLKEKPLSPFAISEKSSSPLLYFFYLTFEELSFIKHKILVPAFKSLQCHLWPSNSPP